MYRIKKSHYRIFAEQIAQQIEGRDWFSGVLEVASDGLKSIGMHKVVRLWMLQMSGGIAVHLQMRAVLTRRR